MAQLDFSPLDRRAQIYRDQARRDAMTQRAVEQTAKGVLDIVEMQRDTRQKLAEATEFDSDITMDAQANAYLANKYNEMMKKPHVEAIMNKRWKTQDHVNKMLATQKQLEREASNVKAMVQARQKAEQQVAQNPMMYEVDREAMMDFDNFLMGKSDAKNGNAFVMGLQREPGVAPFLKIKEHDIDKAITKAAVDISRDPKFTNRVNQITESIQGNQTLKTTEKKEIIDAQIRELFPQLVMDKVMSDNKSLVAGLGKNAMNKLQSKGIAGVGPLDALPAYVYNFDYNPYFGERLVEETISTKPVEEEVDTDRGMRLNFTGDDAADYDSNRTDFSVQGITYKDAFTFPEYKTKERVDVIKDGRQVMGGRKQSPKDVTDVGRIVLYDMDKDAILVQDKNGRYYEAPRKDNEIVLKKLIHSDDYTKILEYQSGRTPSEDIQVEMIPEDQLDSFVDDIKNMESVLSVDEAKAEVEKAHEEGKLSKSNKDKAIKMLESKANKKFFKYNVDKVQARKGGATEETVEYNTGGLY